MPKAREMCCRLSDAVFSALALGALALAAGCQSGQGGPAQGAAAPAPPTAVTASDLLAFCPPVGLREGTAFFTTYATPKTAKPTKTTAAAPAAGGAGADTVAEAADLSDKPATPVVFQTSITDVSRSCTREGGNLTMKVGVAGKVVPGAAARPGNVSLPIRIAVLSGDQVLFTKLYHYDVQISEMRTATQFAFTASDLSFPDPNSRGVRAFAGFDEGPPKQAAN